MVTRQYRRPYLRSPYIREQLDQPKRELSDALDLAKESLDRVRGVWLALRELTEQDAGTSTHVEAGRRQVRNDSESDA